jgi:hypothetical protein
MRGVLRWVLVVVLVLVIAGAVALVFFVQKPTLDDDRNAVDARWSALRPALVTRYERLDAALQAFLAAAGERTVAADALRELAAWEKAVSAGTQERQTDVANRLEGLGVRLRGNVLASPRLSTVTEISDALAAYGGSLPPDELVQRYNRAVRTYEDSRTDTLHVPVARLFGFDSRPTFVIR